MRLVAFLRKASGYLDLEKYNFHLFQPHYGGRLDPDKMKQPPISTRSLDATKTYHFTWFSLAFPLNINVACVSKSMYSRVLKIINHFSIQALRDNS